MKNLCYKNVITIFAHERQVADIDRFVRIWL